MSVKAYARERVGIWVIYGALSLVMGIFLAAFRIQGELIFFLLMMMWAVVIGTEIWELCRKKQFYDGMLRSLAELDNKYLIQELLEQPDFLEGQILCDVLHETNKSMYEHVAGYRQQNREFQEFIELWVHEIKLPVASLSLMMHNHRSEFGSKALEQLRRIDSYTDTVLYFARAEHAEKDYLIKPVSLKRIVSNAALRNREDLLLHGVRLETEQLDVQVLTDGKWLEFILGQFIANSLRYTSGKEDPFIRITAKDLSDRTVLHFYDNGIGIPADDLPHIFTKSFTGHNGRVFARSTGMGLYIVRNLCNRLGHDISVQSEEGKYTELSITFRKNDFYTR